MRSLAARIVLVVSVTLMVVGSLDGDGGECALFHLGLALAVLAGVAVLVTREGASDEVVERARQDGYDDGYRDGCDATRVQTVRRVSSGRPGVRPLRSAAH